MNHIPGSTNFVDRATISPWSGEKVLSPIKVIFLENDHGLRQGLTDFLRLNSISVTDVSSIADFDRAIKGNEFDIALLDVNLPDGSGFETARFLRCRTKIGIIILTARAGRDDRLKGYREGADLYLVKPVDGTELVLAIRNLARRVREVRPTQTAEVAPAQPWLLVRTSQCLVTPQGVSLRLSGREARLVARLAQAGGAAVSRKELADAIGYEELAAENRSIDAVLRRLRQKARVVDIELPIHAIHAVGYRFSVPVIAS